MRQQDLTIINTRGLHARAATKLVQCATQFQSTIKIDCLGKQADCKSVMSVLLLAATVGTEVTIIADGSDEQEALAAVTSLFNNRFDEDS